MRAALLLLMVPGMLGAQEIRWDALTLNRLLTLTAGNHNEFMVCISGIVIDDSTVVTTSENFWIPWHSVSTDTSAVSHGGCPLGTVVDYHNHPSWARPTLTLNQLCSLSKIDISHASVRSIPMVAVGTSDGAEWLVCYWVTGHLNRPN